jgi:hypothetical protein
MKKKAVVGGVAVLAIVLSAGLARSAVSLGDLLQVSKYPTIGTCDALREGSIARQLGGSGEGVTKLCICGSDGAATPSYAWCSLTLAGTSTVVCGAADSVTCP